MNSLKSILSRAEAGKIFKVENFHKFAKKWSSNVANQPKAVPKNKYFLLYKEKRNISLIPKLGIYIGTPLTFQMAYTCKQIADDYKWSHVEGGWTYTAYTVWLGVVTPIVTIVGVIGLVGASLRLIKRTPQKILLSTDHKTVAFITNKLLFPGTKVHKFPVNELTLTSHHTNTNRVTVPNHKTPGKFHTFMLHGEGEIISKPLFNRVFGWTKRN